MKTQKALYPLLAGVLLVLVVVGMACAPAAPAPVQQPPAAAQQQQPPAQVQSTAPDMETVLTKYLSTMPDGFGLIAADKLNEQLAAAKPFLLDLREPKEIETDGYIAGAVNIPIRTLAKNLDKLPTDKTAPIVAYCGSGHRSAIAMAALSQLGYTNVKSLKGGVGAWKAGNFPLAKGVAPTGTAGMAADVNAETIAALDKYLSNIPDGFALIAGDKLKDQLAAAKPFLLDVRETSEVQKDGLIEGAVSVPIRTLMANLGKLPQDRAAPIVVYCASGHRSAIAMEALANMGYTNVKSLKGGLTAWLAANYPVVKSSS